MVMNMRKSMALSIGTTYWKGVFVQCKATSRLNFDCNSYEIPWFTFDSLILSIRCMIVFAVVFGLLAILFGLICGDWNHLLHRADDKINRWIVYATGSCLLISGLFLIITATLFTTAILQQYTGESKIGPRNDLIVADYNSNELKYEFGPCLYLAFTFGLVELVTGILHFFLHPYPSSADEPVHEVSYYDNDTTMHDHENMSVYY